MESCGTGYIIDPETPFKCILDDCDFGYEKDENGVCQIVDLTCPKGETLNDDKTKCIPAPKSGILVPFPFLIAGILLIILALLGKI